MSQREKSQRREESGRKLSVESGRTVLKRILSWSKKHNHPHAPRAPTQTDGRKPDTGGGPRGESPSGLKGKRVCKNFVEGKCTEPSCDLWHRPVCLNYKSESGCIYGDDRQFRNTEAGGQPNKKSKKSGGSGSVCCLVEGDCTIGSCVSQDDPQKKSILREVGKLGSNHTVKFSKGTSHAAKTQERKGPSQGVMQKWERFPWAPKIEERTQDETLKQERCARREAWDLAKDVYKLKKEGQGYALLPAPLRKKPEERELVIDSGAQMHMLTKKGHKLRRPGNTSKIQEPHNSGNGPWRIANERGRTSICSRSCSLHDSAVTRGLACRPVIRYALREGRIHL